MEEIWKDIPGYEGRYQASTMGRIRSLDRYVEQTSRNGRRFLTFRKGRVLRPAVRSNKYLGVNLENDEALCVHHLIALTFHGIKPTGTEIMHLDGNRLNNTPENLAYGTHSENEIDKRVRHHDHGLKLTHQQVREIRGLFQSTKLSNVKIAKRYGVSDALISGIRRGKVWAHLAEEN